MRVFCYIIWNVTMCLFVLPTGLRKVYPYYFTFTTFTKGRWVGEKILDVFAREFRAHPAEEYVSILLNRMLLLLPLNESSGAHKLVRFRQWKIDFHSALWQLTRPTLYWFSTETFVCIQHSTELFILGHSKTYPVTMETYLWRGLLILTKALTAYFYFSAEKPTHTLSDSFRRDVSRLEL
jgi:hypothetical protein